VSTSSSRLGFKSNLAFVKALGRDNFGLAVWRFWTSFFEFGITFSSCAVTVKFGSSGIFTDFDECSVNKMTFCPSR